MTNIKTLIDDISFELELSEKYSNFDYSNIRLVKQFVSTIYEDFNDLNIQTESLLNQLEKLIVKHENDTHSLSKDDLKAVYIMLKERNLNPAGRFDKAGRFYLDDYELVDVRAPSAKYPYSQMQAGRTSKFVKAMADKYNCKTKDELIARFHQP